MTWNETHERTRIIREVEAIAATDMTGALPWREEWSAYFGSPAGLLTALRSRWDRMCHTQLDAATGEDEFQATYGRLRRTHAGVLAILQHAAAPVERLLPVTSPAGGQARRKPRVVRFRSGPVLYT